MFSFANNSPSQICRALLTCSEIFQYMIYIKDRGIAYLQAIDSVVQHEVVQGLVDIEGMGESITFLAPAQYTNLKHRVKSGLLC